MSARGYTAFLVFIAGLGRLLCGYDGSIIRAALLYLNKTIALPVAQASLVVADGFGRLFAGRTLQGLSAGMSAVGILVAACWLPEIKGRTREEIEVGFAR